MSSQTLPFASEDHQPFIVAIMEAQRSPREEEQRDPGRLASFLGKIPSVPLFNLPSKSLQKQRSHATAFKMTTIPKGTVVSKGKQKLLLSNENSTAGSSRSDGNHMKSNGHTPITTQRIESVAVEHSSHSGEASSSVINGCVSATPVVPAPIATATAGPPVVEENSRRHVKKMAHDCYVDLAQPLSPELERAWDTKIHPWLVTNLLHSMDDLNCVSAELVVVGIKHDGSMSPTVLVMCRDLAQKESIEELLKRCPLIPKNLQRRVLIFDILKCTTKTTSANPPSENFLGRQIAIKIDDAHGANVLFANVAEVLPVASDRLSVFCTIGGMLSVNGELYGLTAAHPFADSRDEDQATPIETSGATILGHVAYAQWPNSALDEDDQVDPISIPNSRGEDWALVWFSHLGWFKGLGITCNTFHVPRAPERQKVTGYVKTADLSSGEVWVCAGVSGVQSGYLKQHPASIIMSKSLFAVRSISLKRPLVDGDSGSWVIRDGKLCGVIFCRMGNGVEWAYMLPIEAVFQSISKTLGSLHPDLPSPEVQIAREEVMGGANQSYKILPKPEHRLKRSNSESQILKLSESRSDKHNHEHLPVASTFTRIQHSMERRNSDLTDDNDYGSTYNDYSGSTYNIEPDSIRSTKTAESIAWARKAVLSLDGGGVRVYSSLLILKEIMETIIRHEKSYPDEPTESHGPAESSYHPLRPSKADVWLPCHYFDYIGGTGNGGLIAIMLGRLRMNVHDSILAFEGVLKDVFYHKRWFHHRSYPSWPRPKFDHQILEQAIQNLVKHHAPEVISVPRSFNFEANENQCRTIVLAYDRQERQEIPYLFRTYKKSDSSISVWQVARATTASPAFFQPVIINDHKYVNSKFGMNNPCAEIYEEVQDMDGIDNVDIILSIGTGKHRILSLTHPLFDFDSPFELKRIPQNITSKRDYCRLDVEALGQMKTDQWQVGGRVRTIIGSITGRHRSKKKAAAPGQGSETGIANSDNPLFPFINTMFSIAKWFQPRNVTEESIRKHTRDYLDREDVQSEINEIAKILVQKRRNRVKSDIERWEKFCCHEIWYQCKVQDCPRHEKKYSSRSALRTHILDKHSDKYSRRDQGALEAALDEGRITGV